MMASIKRKYALTKIGAGDYIMPSNDGESLWRITRGTEWSDEAGKEIECWRVWGPLSREKAQWQVDYGDLLDWDAWGLYASWMGTRRDAIAAALEAAA